MTTYDIIISSCSSAATGSRASHGAWPSFLFTGPLIVDADRASLPSARTSGFIRLLRAAFPGNVGDAADCDGGPAGLMTGSKAATGIAVKIFVKEHKLSPMWIGGKARIVTIAGTPAVCIREEEAGQAGTSSRGGLGADSAYGPSQSGIRL